MSVVAPVPLLLLSCRLFFSFRSSSVSPVISSVSGGGGVSGGVRAVYGSTPRFAKRRPQLICRFPVTSSFVSPRLMMVWFLIYEKCPTG